MNKTDIITEIGIDAKEQLYIKPESHTFPYIYREAMEVNWNPDLKVLNSPKPREWSYQEWFVQIVKAANIQGCILLLSSDTTWVNISEELKTEIVELAGNNSM